MVIRKAILTDAPAIAHLLLLAMEEIIYTFLGNKDEQQAVHFLQHFVEGKSNQYAYENCWVVEDNNQVIGAVNMYDGAKLLELRAPIITYVKQFTGQDFQPELETQAGEYYIDSLGVAKNQQGKGVGSKLLQFIINEYVVKQQNTIGLLVDDLNPDAKKLYLKLGFKSVGKKTLVGKNLEHLQIRPD